MLNSINKEQRLYVLRCGSGYSCLGFEYAEKRRRAVLYWIGETPESMRLGTKKHYAAYGAAMAKGAAHNIATKSRCDAELTPELMGREGDRVAILQDGAEISRFYVGKSTGWLPCHLEIKTCRSHGGGAVYFPEGATVQTIKRRAW